MWIEQNLILTLVILVSIVAHVWMYGWIKFKMDEGAVLRYLKDTPVDQNDQSRQVRAVEQIASIISMKESRVIFISEKSHEIFLENGLCFLTSESKKI